MREISDEVQQEIDAAVHAIYEAGARSVIILADAEEFILHGYKGEGLRIRQSMRWALSNYGLDIENDYPDGGDW